MNSKRKKCLVTGAAGFIGSHLTELLLENGYKVRALAQYNSFNSWGWLEDIPKHQGLEIITGDIRDPYLCRSITKEIDIVFHLAALIAIPYSYIAPDSYVDTNVRGTLNMCQAARENGVQQFIHTSTSEVYGTAKYVPIDEKHSKQPQSPYSASKIGADAIALSFYNSFSFPITVARPFNTYGPRQSARAIIPTIISQILSGNKSIKIGDLSPTRDLNYVKDTCKGFLALVNNNDVVGREINISSNFEISMGEVLKKIIKILGADITTESDEKRIRPANSEVFRLLGDNSLIKELTGYKPEYTLDHGLQLTCDWFLRKENRAKYKTDIYNV
jgi:NAD dependent epimerase/dehydratase